MEGIEYKGPRIAPGPERSDKEPLLDAVVVIPAMDEGVNIIDTIESIASQRKSKDKTLVQGAVVVINNRPNASQEVLASNMRTYTLLQGIRHGCKMSVRGNVELTEKIRKIQESGLQIEVLDGFSEEHAHPESNVGRARKIGTEHALGLMKDEHSTIMSTDADTVLGLDALRVAQHIFEKEKVDATPMELGRKVNDLDARSKEAYRRYSLYWKLNYVAQNIPEKTHGLRTKGLPFSLTRPSKVGTSAVWLSGGGTAFTAEAYKKSGGYRPIGREEDTLLAADMVKAGVTLKDMSQKYPQLIAYTRPRISLRTERGFGHTIADWDKPEIPLGSIEVSHPDALRAPHAFFSNIDKMLGKPRDIVQEQKFRKLCGSYGMPENTATSLWEIFSKWDGFPSREEHFRFMESANAHFRNSLPRIMFAELIQIGEKENSSYSEAVQAAHWKQIKIGPDEEEWEWKAYQHNMRELLSELRVNADDSESKTKIDAIIAAEYVPHFEPLVRDYMFMAVNMMREGLKRRRATTPEEKKLLRAKHLDTYTAEEYYRLTLCQKEAVKIAVLQDCKQLLGEAITSETQRNIDAKLKQLRENYADFADAIITNPHKAETK